MTTGATQVAPPLAGRLVAIAVCAYCLMIFWQAMAFGQVALSVPVSYDGDGLQYSYIIEAFASAGGLGEITNSGAPFGTQNLDFPNADVGNLLLASMVAGDGQFGERFNLYLLLTIALTSLSAFFTARLFGIRPLWAAAAAVAFTLLPFHFLRVPHLFYTNYSAAAVSVALALRISMPRSEDAENLPLWRKAISVSAFVLGCAWCASTGVYYAFFSSIVIACAGALASLRNGNWLPAKRAALALVVIVAILALQLAPTAALVQKSGQNESVAKRSFQETEVYGLRLTQLVLPTAGHRLQTLANLRNRYDQHAPNVNENSTATLGLFGVFGLAAALVLLVVPRLRQKLPWNYELVSALLLILLLFATVGGLGSLFSLLITPQIRALNRISPFIALLAVLIAAGVIQTIVDRLRVGILHPVAAVVAIILIVYDQVPYRMGAHNEQRSLDQARFDSDRMFARETHAILGEHARVLQLPYIEYPETGAAIGDYTQFRNNLHAPSIHWTHGAMKGRPEGNWLRMLSSLPPRLFVRTLRAADFSGVVVDERGSSELIAQQAQAFAASAPSRRIVSKDGTQSGYLLPGARREGALALAPARGWYPLEYSGDTAWIWSSGDATLQLSPPTSSTQAACTARLSLNALRPQHISASSNGRTLGSVALNGRNDALFSFVVPAGTRVLTLHSDVPPLAPGNGDPRLLGFQWQIVDPPACF